MHGETVNLVNPVCFGSNMRPFSGSKCYTKVKIQPHSR